jgi:hypothetical protein
MSAIARREWQAQLLPFLPHPVPVEQVLSDLQILLPALWKEAGFTG